MDELEGTTRVRHGTYSAAIAGCKCTACRGARAEYARGYRARNLERVRAIERESRRRTLARLQGQVTGVMSDG